MVPPGIAVQACGTWRASITLSSRSDHESRRTNAALEGMPLAALATVARLARASISKGDWFMKGFIKKAVLPLCVTTLCAVPAMAQQSAGGTSYMPYTSGGYVGINVGKPNYKLPCTAGFNCDDPNTSYNIYTGGSFNQWLGAEVGYLYLGKADRQGGTTRGHGLNLSLVGTVPVGQAFKLFGKVGATWGRTTVSANPLSGEPTGDKNGFGTSYGVGGQYDINRDWAAVLQWDRNSMKFAGRGREDIAATSVGVKYKF
jgi:hypothetical protein